MSNKPDGIEVVLGCLGIVIVMLFVLWATGCSSQLPVCERFKYRVAHDEEGTMLFVLDQDNAVKMSLMVKGLAEGKCRMKVDGEV